MVGVLELMNHMQQQGEAGRARGQNNRLSQLASKAYGAPQPDQRQFVQQAIQNDAATGIQLGQSLNTDNDHSMKQLSQRAALFVNVAKAGNPQHTAGMYSQLANEAIRLGHNVPTEYDEKMLPMLEQLASVGSGGDSASLREFNAMTRGLSPEDRLKAQRVNLGLDGRASSSGYTQVKFTDSQGRERVGSFNGRTGSIDLPDGTSFNPQTGQTTQTQAAPQTQFAAPPQGPQSGQPFTIDPSLPPEVQASIRNNEQAWASAPDQSTAQIPARSMNTGTQWPQAPAQSAPVPQPGGDAFTSRPIEQQAGLTTGAQEQAKIDAYLNNAGTVGATEASVAGMKSRAEAQAKADVEQGVRGQVRSEGLRAELPALKASQRSLLDAYRGLQEGRYTSGPIVGMVPDRWQTEANQQLATTINEEILAVAERMKGTLSDKDVAFLRSATFGLDKKPQANMNIIGRKLQIINDAIKRGEGQGAQSQSPAQQDRPASGGWGIQRVGN